MASPSPLLPSDPRETAPHHSMDGDFRACDIDGEAHLWGVPAICRYVGHTRSWFYRAVKEGGFPARRLRLGWVARPAAVDAWIRAPREPFSASMVEIDIPVSLPEGNAKAVPCP